LVLGVSLGREHGAWAMGQKNRLGPEIYLNPPGKKKKNCKTKVGKIKGEKTIPPSWGFI